MPRREFTRNQREQIAERSKNARGEICCERCRLVLAGKPYEIDHIIAEALRPEADKQQPITIAEGQLLGKDCCHRGKDGKTNQDVKAIAKAKRQNARHLGIIDGPKMASRGFATKSSKTARREKHAAEVKQLAPRRLFWTAPTPNPSEDDAHVGN